MIDDSKQVINQNLRYSTSQRFGLLSAMIAVKQQSVAIQYPLLDLK
jgi:hypothetical protein